MTWATISGVLTGILLTLFIGIIIWAWHPRRRKTFNYLANIPLENSLTDQEKQDE